MMTPYERVMTTLEGGEADRTPVFPVVRDWAVRQAGFAPREAFDNVAKYVYAQYFCREKFGYDMVRDLAGVHAESEAMGSTLKISKGGSIYVDDYFLKDYDRDLARLKIPNPWNDGRLPVILEGTKKLKEMGAGKFPVLAYLQAPFRHASMLRGTDDIMKDTYKRPDKVRALLEITTTCQIVYGIACLQAGADILYVCDPSSSGDLVSVKTWEEFGLPYVTRLIRHLKTAGAKVILHICGDTCDRLESLASTGADCLSLDSKVDFLHARKILGEKCCLMGNVDSTFLLPFGKPAEVEKEARKIIEKGGLSGNLILSSGCVVPAATPPENISAMVRAAMKGAES